MVYRSRIAFPLRLPEDWRLSEWEAAVSELTREQARAKCHQSLVDALRLIRPNERVRAICGGLARSPDSRKTTSERGVDANSALNGPVM